MPVLLSRLRRYPAWLGRRPWSPEAKAIGATILCTLAIVAAGGMVWADVRDVPDPPEGEQTVAFAESEHGRLLFELSAVAVGSRVVTADTESFRWTELAPASGRLDTGVGRVQVANGPVAPQALTEARLTFDSVAYMVEGTLHQLPVPQDTLRLRVPGEPGQPGDRLLVVLDVNQSVRVIDDLFVFEPFVSEARWLGGDPATTASADQTMTQDDVIAPRPSAYVSDSSDDEDDPTTSSDGDDTTNDPPPPPSDVGKLRIYVRDAPLDQVRSLHATFGRIALDRQDSTTSETFYDGARTVDLRAFAGPDDRAELVTFQTKATTYESLRLEFTGATADISLSSHELKVPQPILVIEKPFVVAPGQTTELLVDFSIEESLVLGADGWEFRPVVFQFQTSETDLDDDGVHDVADPDDDEDGRPDSEDADRDGDGVPDPKPAQFRTGGSSLPTLGPAAGAPAPTPEPVEELEEEESRPIGSEGSLPDLPVDQDDLLDKPLKDVKLVGFPVWVVAGRSGRRASAAPVPGTP